MPAGFATVLLAALALVLALWLLDEDEAGAAGTVSSAPRCPPSATLGSSDGPDRQTAARRVSMPLVLAVLGGLLIGTGAGTSLARYVAASTVGGNTVTTAARFDATPPSIAGSVIAKASGTGLYLAGQIKARRDFLRLRERDGHRQRRQRCRHRDREREHRQDKRDSRRARRRQLQRRRRRVQLPECVAGRDRDGRPELLIWHHGGRQRREFRDERLLHREREHDTARAADIQTTNGGTAGRPDAE